VLVVQHFLDCDRDQALAIVSDLMNSRMHQFQHVIAAELPVLCDDFELDDAARGAVAGYVRQMQNWLSGILNWHQGCDRYDETALRDRYGATGIVEAMPVAAGAASGFGRFPAFHSAHVPC